MFFIALIFLYSPFSPELHIYQIGVVKIDLPQDKPKRRPQSPNSLNMMSSMRTQGAGLDDNRVKGPFSHRCVPGCMTQCSVLVAAYNNSVMVIIITIIITKSSRGGVHIYTYRQVYITTCARDGSGEEKSSRRSSSSSSRRGGDSYNVRRLGRQHRRRR